ncbi:FadR/GntR family transcriptional regulator [Pelobacter seleniigenes]|uniref:FadR/GntR family transcriptional regulator n=1 Tax=Pelobacter seleniigenes TaxID=407188 RepID=UPI0006925F99|nr:FadR/GntR family transcriptional regulator [Pelobacter seleniigenes]
MANSSSPVTRTRLHEQVARSLSLQILRRELEPLSLLPNEDELCRQFDVSRTVIREAIRFMDAKGLVEVRPRIGTRICDPSRWVLTDSVLLKWRIESELEMGLIKDLVELRSMIEPMAASFAAERASDEEIKAVEAAFKDMEKATNLDEQIEADIRFHLSILEACGNELVVSSLRPVIESILGSVFRRYMEFDAAKKSLAVHGKLFRAIADRNSEQAMIEMQEMISYAGRDFKEFEKLSQQNQ